MKRVLLFLSLSFAIEPSLFADARQATEANDDARTITIATPIYFSDGHTGGGSAGWRLKPGDSFTGYPKGGYQLCGGDDAEKGWQVEGTFVSQTATGVRLHLAWHRISANGVTLGQLLQSLKAKAAVGAGSNDAGGRFLTEQINNLTARLNFQMKGRPHGETDIVVQPGDRTVLDFIGTTDRLSSTSPPQSGAPATACTSIGIGLEVRIDPPQHPPVLETDIWLVRTPAGGADDVQHQVIRSEARNGSGYWFDEVTLRPGAAPANTNQPMAALAIKVSGAIVPVESTAGRIHLKLTIGRATTMISSAAGGSETRTPSEGGSATYDVAADPGEVVAFQLPPILVRGLPLDRLSVRVRSHWLK